MNVMTNKRNTDGVVGRSEYLIWRCSSRIQLCVDRLLTYVRNGQNMEKRK